MREPLDFDYLAACVGRPLTDAEKQRLEYRRRECAPGSFFVRILERMKGRALTDDERSTLDKNAIELALTFGRDHAEKGA